MSFEDEFELNYIKIDSKDEIKLLETDDSVAEISNLFTKVGEFGEKKMTKNIIKDLEKIIPQNSELLKYNFDFSKKFIKIINSDKKNNFNESVKRILSIDFENEFIFNYSNIYDVCNIICLFFSEYKKYKISSIDDLKNIIKKINLQQYDFYRLYVDFNQIRKKTVVFNKTQNSSQLDNKNILEENIKSNYVLNNDYTNLYINEDKENDLKLISKKIFIYPDYNKIGNKDQGLNKTDLPIELILILSKLREVNTLIFQIQNVDTNYISLATFILANIEWLFIKDIKEVKFDINNEDIQQGLNKLYNLKAENYYKKYKINKNKIFYNGIYSARNINCWVPESDVFFYEETQVLGDEYIYKTQLTEDSVILNDNICNIYNAYGNLMNIRYFPNINFSLKNYFNNHILKHIPKMRSYSQCSNDVKKLKSCNNNGNIDYLNDLESIFNIDEENNYLNSKRNNESNMLINNAIFDMENIGKNYKEYFNMIVIYCYYLGKYLKKMEKLSMYFENSFTFEINNLYKIDINSEYIHFLFLLNKVESLKDISFSFNSLDDNSFEYILGILNKNTGLSKLRISFFTPDINYYDNSLFDLCASKKIDLSQLFPEFNLYQMKHWKNKTKKINEYILNEKLLNPFILNLCNLSNLLKLQLLNNLEELIFRFDIPIPLTNNQEYIITIIKFLINIFIMITFQQNKTKTFKILAQNLEFNGKKMPFIRTLFNEISLSKDAKMDINKNYEDKFSFKLATKESNNINKRNESEKDVEPKIENKNEVINKDGAYSPTSQEKSNEYETDTDTNIENLENSNKSFNKAAMPKNSNEKAAIRNELTDNNNSNNNNNNNIASRKLNPNVYLENLVLHMKISNLPEIFNFCIINNLAGLKYINLGYLDEITFKGFVNDYKLNCNKLRNLISIKINLGFSVISFDNLENYIYDFININTPKLMEKILLTNLKINSEVKMKELIELVYLKAKIEKIVVKLNYSNIDLLSKLLSQFFIDYKSKYKDNINSIVFLMNHPKFKYINKKDIIKNFLEFIIFNKTRNILCNEYF